MPSHVTEPVRHWMSLTETGALAASSAPATVDAADLRVGAMRGGSEDMRLPIQVIWCDGSPMVLVGWGIRWDGAAPPAGEAKRCAAPHRHDALGIVP